MSEDVMEYTQPEDLLKFGLIPELIGRLPIIAPLQSLNEDALRNVLTEPKNAIVKQFKKLFMLEGVELEIDPLAIETIVKKAIERKTGARALRAIVENFMTNIMFDLPSKENVSKCIITRDTVEEGKEPIYIEADRKTA
jgi:ATP-dependent Clp protease ATP-binding subunit ClpX